MTTLTDFGECDDCEQLPDGWCCADCYIKDGKEMTTDTNNDA